MPMRLTHTMQTLPGARMLWRRIHIDLKRLTSSNC
ncbi:MAG: putative leader peptide [Brevibacterium aurantiacum]